MESSLFQKIIDDRDVSGFLALNDSLKEDFLIELMGNLSRRALSEMNEVQKTLFLAMRLEDACQADGLPSLSEEKEIFLSLSETASAYERLGAPQTARCLKEFISLLPENQVPEWDWFFDAERKDRIDKIDGEICDYPDGLMRDHYIAYSSNPETAAQLFEHLK